MKIIEMTLAEKLVTACIDQLKLNDEFHSWWHQLGRVPRDPIMANMRHEVQVALDRELLAHPLWQHIRDLERHERLAQDRLAELRAQVSGLAVEDAGSGGIPTGPQILTTTDRLDGGGLPKRPGE